MAKIGEGHAEGMARQGLRELRASLYTGSNVAQQPEYGLYGTLTPGEVAESRRDQNLDLEQESPQQESILNQRLEAAKTREPSGKEDRRMEMER